MGARAKNCPKLRPQQTITVPQHCVKKSFDEKYTVPIELTLPYVFIHLFATSYLIRNLLPTGTVPYIKVPSGQIGFAWEWYHWKALSKDINRYMFLILNFWSWIFCKSSKFWAAPCKNESNLLLVQFTVCIESCLPIGWRTVIWRKNPPKPSSFLVWIAEWCNFLLTSRNPKTNWCLSRIYGVRFGEKDRGLSTCKPWTEQAGGLEDFLHGAAQNLELLSNIQDQK